MSRYLALCVLIVAGCTDAQLQDAKKVESAAVTACHVGEVLGPFIPVPGVGIAVEACEILAP